MSTIRVFNLNLLSTKLCSPGYHRKCNPAHLKTSSRWWLIQKQLNDQILLNAVICLQELTEEWLSLLLPFFTHRNYMFVYDSQWLGVGIALPTGEFSLQKVTFFPIGENIKSQCVYKQQYSNTCLLSLAFWRQPLMLAKKCFIMIKNMIIKQKDDVWHLAGKRSNRMIGIQLMTLNGHLLNVYTYHMPCAFQNPSLMNIHAAQVVKTVQETAGIFPYILAGDFNSVQNTDVYKMITQGIMPKFASSTIFSKVPTYYGFASMQSAYVSKQKKEPFFTCYSHVHDLPFMDCIDYIFHSSSLNCIDVLPTRSERPTSTFPNEEEGSDHLAIGALFLLTHS